MEAYVCLWVLKICNKTSPVRGVKSVPREQGENKDHYK